MTNTPIGVSIIVGQEPWGIAFDSVNGNLDGLPGTIYDLIP